MALLEDIVAADLRVLFVAINPPPAAAASGLPFASGTNAFWRLLHESGLVTRRYAPSEAARLIEEGIGLWRYREVRPGTCELSTSYTYRVRWGVIGRIFDRIVFRADWGVPLSPGYRTFPGAFFVSFAQAFAMPQVVAPSVLTETL